MPDINEELRYQRRIIREFGIDTLSFWYYLTPYKCCNCYPKFHHEWVGMYNTKEFLRCENCGRQTEPVEDYSWQKTTKAWIEMMKGGNNDRPTNRSLYINPENRGKNDRNNKNRA